jgi:hypothetical protein
LGLTGLHLISLIRLLARRIRSGFVVLDCFDEFIVGGAIDLIDLLAIELNLSFLDLAIIAFDLSLLDLETGLLLWIVLTRSQSEDHHADQGSERAKSFDC